MNDTREYIIDKAFKLFLSSSYEAVSISDISSSIGFTKGALYHHFKNKEELFKAVIDKHFIILEMKVDVVNITLKDFGEACISHAQNSICQLFSDTSEFSPIDFMSLISDSFRHYPGYAEDKGRFMDSEINKIKRILDRAIERGEIRPDINSTIIAHSYFSYMIGMAGPLIKNYPIDTTIEMLRDQINEIYKLLKI